MPLYALTIFLSAFLLFQVQPLIAKTILPWFGGTASVWTTCMLDYDSRFELRNAKVAVFRSERAYKGPLRRLDEIS